MPVDPEARSVMNVVFRLPHARRSTRSSSPRRRRPGMVGLKGHRVVGGIRASIYNAVQLSWAEALAEFMGQFAAHHA